MKTLYFAQMERSDVLEIQDLWKTDEGQAGGERRSNEIRRFLMFQVGNYRPQRSCEGYVFTGVCLSTGGCLLLVPGVCFWCMGRHPPPGDGYCCGRYASYWNAFLFIMIINRARSVNIWISACLYV